LQANITIENKAMVDYVALLKQVGEEFGPELQTILQHNLADERCPYRLVCPAIGGL